MIGTLDPLTLIPFRFTVIRLAPAGIPVKSREVPLVLFCKVPEPIRPIPPVVPLIVAVI
jgi:hypothetical protein